MPRRLLVLLQGIGIVVAARVVVADQTTYRGTADLVSVFATVVDEHGRLVTDLTQEDFEIRDNGSRRPLAVFSNAPAPFSAVIMLDRSGSMADHFDLIRDAAAAFIDEMMPDDRARVGSFARDIRLSPESFTTSHDVLKAALREDLQDMGPSPVWTAIDKSMTAVLPMPDRRVVLVFTDGHDDPEYGQVRTTLADLLRRTRVNGVMVYAIGFAAEMTTLNRPTPFDPRRPRGPIRFPIPGMPPAGPRGPQGPAGPTQPGSTGAATFGKRFQPPDPGLKDLARESGGGYFEMDEDSDLRSTFVRVAQELRRQYWLGFAPAALDGKTHEIEVRVRRRGLEVRARRHYVASR